MGFEKTSDVIAFLDLMLECERAGAKALRQFERMTPPEIVAETLPRLFGDEARYCAGLSRQIIRLGANPGGNTGAFLEKILAATDWPARLDLLARGQMWVAKRLDECLASIDDAELTAFLTEMRDTHIANVAEARRLARAVGGPDAPSSDI